jgi:hypothetical protein
LTPQKWTFFVRQKCPFWPLRAANFKNEMQNIKIWGCDHYALISVFSCKKTVTDFFWGRRRRSNWGVKNGHFCITDILGYKKIQKNIQDTFIQNAT